MRELFFECCKNAKKWKLPIKVATFFPASVPSGAAWSSLELFCLNFISPRCITTAVTCDALEENSF